MAGDRPTAIAILLMESMEEAGLPPVTWTGARKMAEALDARCQIQLRKDGQPRQPWTRWTDDEKAQLRALAADPDLDTAAIAKALGTRTQQQVRSALDRFDITLAGEHRPGRPRRSA